MTADAPVTIGRLAMVTEARLELTQVGKGFGGTTVLRDVSFQLHAGRILGLVGQNGAGKSTLVKILAGLYPDYTGTIRLDGQAVRLVSPRQARAAGVAVIYQEFSLVPEMTVAENLLLGREPGTWAYSSRSTSVRAAEVVEQVGIEIGVPLNTPVSGLSPAVKQRIEIVKALSEEGQGAPDGRAHGPAVQCREPAAVRHHARAQRPGGGRHLHLSLPRGGAGHHGLGHRAAQRPGGRLGVVEGAEPRRR